MEPIIWEGDLDDDCRVLDWHGLGAHAECLSDVESEDEPDDFECWHCSVWRVGQRGVYVFHSGDQDTFPLTGTAARGLCKLVMKATVYDQEQS